MKLRKLPPEVGSAEEMVIGKEGGEVGSVSEGELEALSDFSGLYRNF